MEIIAGNNNIRIVIPSMNLITVEWIPMIGLNLLLKYRRDALSLTNF